uniref:Thioredoxin-like protein-2 n=1 Tax=Inonotus obliquus TaxID=167356 RepID=A0A0N9JZB1_9AGAM|nr:thioredoxin-like protein-2 [Inonotus obliquus]
MANNLNEISSLSELQRIIEKSPDKLTVIDFYATWCGPCKMMAPTFAEVAKSTPNVNFVKCDVDKAQDVAKEYKISAMPTFAFVRPGSEPQFVRGAMQKDKFKAVVEQHAAGLAGGTTPFSGRGQTLGGAPAAPPIGTGGIINLSPQAKVLLGLVGAYLLLWYFS